MIYNEKWWKELKEKLIKKRGNRCERCGKFFHDVKGFLLLHHKDRNTDNNNPSNLKLVCRECHRQEHKEIDPLFYEKKREELIKLQAKLKIK